MCMYAVCMLHMPIYVQQGSRYTRKWFPLQGERAQSLKVFNVATYVRFQKQNRNEKEETEQQ